jgi:hypothetical protein
MPDNYLPSALDCNLCSASRRDGPTAGADVGARIECVDVTTEVGNHETQPSTLPCACCKRTRTPEGEYRFFLGADRRLCKRCAHGVDILCRKGNVAAILRDDQP